MNRLIQDKKLTNEIIENAKKCYNNVKSIKLIDGSVFEIPIKNSYFVGDDLSVYLRNEDTLDYVLLANKEFTAEIIERKKYELNSKLLENQLNTPKHYDNTKGTLYKVATERGWNSYLFDIVKRLERADKKGEFKQDLEKSINVIKLWLNESE